MPADPLEELDPRTLGMRLKEARQAGGWTQEQAAEVLGASRTTMVAIEKGERRLSSDELVKLARLYGRKLATLVRPSVPVEGFAVQLRGALPPDSPVDAELLPSIEELEKLSDDFAELERMTGSQRVRREPPLYPIDGVDPEQAAEDVATAERNRLGLGDAPVLNLRQVLEGEAALQTYYLDLPSKVAGMFAYSEDYGGVIAINRKHPSERRRQSMAHEYGHYLTDRFRSEVTILGRYQRRPAGERFAEGFGRAFLMPAASLKRQFHELLRRRASEGSGGPTAGDLCHLADIFYVSFEAISRRLEELDLIPAGTWERLHQQGFKVREARQLLGLRERVTDDALLPARYRFLAVEAWHRGDLSEGQLAAFLRVDRLTSRRMVRELGLDHDSGGDGSLDLFLPLASAGAG